MGKTLAIKGHETRGKEVIELFEMMGGENINVTGRDVKGVYLISTEGTIETHFTYYKRPEYYAIFTLEEFLEKYPFKVGDRVRIPEYESEVIIDKMYWDGNEIQYEVYTDEVETYSAEELNQWNESKTKMNNSQESLLKKNSITISSLCYEDEVKLNFSCEYDLIERDGKHILIKKKSKYPKTYEECCDVLNIDPIRKIEYEESWGFRILTQYDTDILTQLKHFRKLLICRDAYWKMAGEEMGLGKPWEPAIQDSIWGITRSKDEIEKYSCHFGKTNPLEFPTVEMRDAFYENFKDLIEQCKELL